MFSFFVVDYILIQLTFCRRKAKKEKQRERFVTKTAFYQKYPEEHKSYLKEWKLFYHRRKTELLAGIIFIFLLFFFLKGWMQYQIDAECCWAFTFPHLTLIWQGVKESNRIVKTKTLKDVFYLTSNNNSLKPRPHCLHFYSLQCLFSFGRFPKINIAN